jgi:cytidylate kinase
MWGAVWKARRYVCPFGVRQNERQMFGEDDREAESVRRHVLRGVIAIDGPSGTGKSTVARRLALDLGAGYLDTGAMYRALTLATLRAGLPPEEAASLLPGLRLTVSTDPAAGFVLLNVEDVATQIRGSDVTMAVSPVSAVPRVREHLVDMQRRLIDRVLDETGGIVVEGRDIGTAVAPEAGLKVYLTAAASARAERRTVQDGAAGRVSTVDATLAEVLRRDAYDSGRAASPLRRADDAVEVDTTTLDIEGVLCLLHGLAAERRMAAPVVRA